LLFSLTTSAQHIDVPANISLKKSFRVIEKQTDYTFFYSDDEIAIDANTQKRYLGELKNVLEELSSTFNFEFYITEKRIVVTPHKEKPLNIEGTIYDEIKHQFPV